ncbi:hypothetical protein M8C21_025716 [Ambrosia artemisiifolia]|uniref:Uncharacterized protein n=1 Tax=Ambrosia artemisiifolia TaxID=4212 RepID=A0AAD5GDP7_AMBAR|nr:hypothetical protein M8C21_025716 [Ambrosia artemisiifolia]
MKGMCFGMFDEKYDGSKGVYIGMRCGGLKMHGMETTVHVQDRIKYLYMVGMVSARTGLTLAKGYNN